MDIENRVHIWELPEKTNDIDKINDCTIIHDGKYSKQVTLEKIYDYFNQNYKIDNIVRYFDVLMETENKRYKELYDTLEESINIYNRIIEELSEDSNAIKHNIRNLELSINNADFIIKAIQESFKNIDEKNLALTDLFAIFQDDLNAIEEDKFYSDLSQLEESVNTIVEDKNTIQNNDTFISDSLSRIPSNNNDKIENERTNISVNINNEYEKIVSIIDYYHHIHDNGGDI